VQPPFPFVLGTEFAGRIAKDSPIPKGCPHKPGDRVFGFAQGAYAERVTCKGAHLLPLPDRMSYDDGAGEFSLYLREILFAYASTGLHITWPTSYEALVGRAELKAGEYTNADSSFTCQC